MSASSPWVRDVTEETFETDVLEASETAPVLVDFWSPRCPPCRILGPLLERLVNERQGQVILAKVNTDEAPRLATYFRVNGIPDVKVIQNRQLVYQFVGLRPEPELRELIDNLIGMGADPEMLNAQAAEESAPERAEKLYREMLEKEPDKAEARLGLARSLLAQERLDEIQEVLDPIDSGGDAGTEAEGILARIHLIRSAQPLPDELTLRQKVSAEPNNPQVLLDLGTVLAARGDFARALPLLLSAGEKDAKLLSSKVREVMVKVFFALGQNDPLSNEYRSKLSRLLY